MLTQQRKQHILSVLKRDGQVIAKTISSELGLSEDTIRRDLRELAQEGLLQRVHGGALPASPAVVDFAGRQEISTDAKKRIGRAAAKMIRPGQLVILDGGTTTSELARNLPSNLKATIVTHSPTIAVILADHPTIEVIVLGGRLFKHSVVSVGAEAIEATSRFNADIYVMGVTGIHPEAGATTGDFEEAQVKRALSAASAETIVLASAEKLNAASPYRIVPIGEINGIVTEEDVAEVATKPFVDLGISVTRV